MIRNIFILLAFFSIGLHAEEDPDCLETAMTQTEINMCMGSKNQDVEELLAQLVTELKILLPEEPERNLDISQQAWATVVDNDCEIESWYVDGGSARPMVVAGCFAEHSRQRISMLLPLLCHPMQTTCEEKDKYESNL